MNEEMQAQLGSILSDPQQMEKIKAMAQSLMGGMGAGGTAENAAEPVSSPTGGGLMGLLGKTTGSGTKSESEQLLRAMQPYMRPKRRTKIDRALKLTRLIGLAETMLEQYGGELDGL